EPIEKVLIESIAEKDILFQRDSPQGHVCNGFILVRANERTLHFLKSLRSLCTDYDGKYDDQDITNAELVKHALPQEMWDQPSHELENEPWYRHNQDFEKLPLIANDYNLNWGYLPETFCSAGTISGEFWEPGRTLVVPERPLIHHANWTIGVPHKLAQLEL